MNNLRAGGLLCDVTLVAENHEIPAHKMILAACSPYFYAMFTGFTERDSDRVIIHGVEPEALNILVDYVYTSQVFKVLVSLLLCYLYKVNVDTWLLAHASYNVIFHAYSFLTCWSISLYLKIDHKQKYYRNNSSNDRLGKVLESLAGNKAPLGVKHDIS